MRVARGASGADASYAAFTQRRHAEQRAQYASLSFAQEQRRLRIHLRRVLLVHDASTSESKATHESTTGMASATEVPWSHWREMAVARDASKAHRRASACLIQHNVRRWLVRRHNVELPSTSEWIAVISPNEAASTRRRDAPGAYAAKRVVVAHESELPATPATLTEPFQVIVELLGARDLALPPQQDGFADVTVAVRLVLQPTNEELGGLEASAVLSAGEDVQWDDQVLQLGVETAESALRDDAVEVEIFAVSRARRTALGRVTVALDLLETPLADKSAMTRWFPLERGRGATVRQAKGEVRLGIRLLMRNPTSGRVLSDDVWIPYEAAPPSPPPPRQQASATRGREANAKIVSNKPPLSPRKQGTSPRVSPARNASRAPASRAQYTRAEAMSPPSSPSSYYSSDSNAEFSPQKSPLSPQLSRNITRRGSTAPGGIVATATSRREDRSKTGRGGHSTDEQSMSPERDASDTSDKRAKPMFLKRKPYKAVFQKLDWSRVNSKTDSNWASGGKATGATHKSGSSPRRLSSELAMSRTPTLPRGTASAAAPSPKRSTTAASEQIAAVAQRVYAACRVTKETAALAQMRFRAERRRWRQSHEGVLGASTTDGGAVTSLPAHDAANALDDASLRALWTTLQRDADGATYAALLREATLASPSTSSCT